MLREENVVDRIEILEDGHIQIRTAQRVYKDGVLVAQNYHRRTIPPGQYVGREEPKIQDIARVVHTPEVVSAYRNKSRLRDNIG